jgi:hypothetical protein
MGSVPKGMMFSFLELTGNERNAAYIVFMLRHLVDGGSNSDMLARIVMVEPDL